MTGLEQVITRRNISINSGACRYILTYQRNKMTQV